MTTTPQQNHAKAGTILCVSIGVYDYCRVIKFYTVQQDFDPQEELENYLDANPSQRDPYSFESRNFLETLLSKGLLSKVSYGTMHLSDYADHKEFRFVPVEQGE